MLVPSVFGDSLFDDWMDDFGFPGFHRSNYGRMASGLMRTDIRETENGYELNIDLPGYQKDDVQVQLKDGYLTVSAKTNEDQEQKDGSGKYIRRERYSGSVRRSFYIGKNTSEQEIRARFENGILKLSLPKTDPKKVEEHG